MLTIRLSPDVCRTIASACRSADPRETGGMLFGEHMAEGEFRVVEATVAGKGTIASFIRGIVDGLTRLESFFQRTRRDYRRFNYLGEWHSHPSFALRPSVTDDSTMFDLVTDPSTQARFAVSIIVKLEGVHLRGEAFAYFPTGLRETCRLIIETQGELGAIRARSVG